jgi:purine nucleoside phosphorylase
LSVHVFCDESKASGFRLAAVVVKTGELAGLRSTVSALQLPRQRRLHFANESDGRRRKIINALAAARVRAVVYEATGYRNEKEARDAVIGQLTDDVVVMGASTLILERDDSAVMSDKQIIIDRLDKAGSRESLRYEHRRAHEECLLSVPDAVIWAWAKGGRWRHAVGSLVTDVVAV